MNDIEPMPASGDAHRKGAPDGVSGIPGGGSTTGADDARNVHGRTEGGESGGTNYSNPQTGKRDVSGDGGSPGGGDRPGFNEGASGHGGQTQIDYYGSGQRGAGGAAAENAVADSDSCGHDTAEAPAPAADRPPHQVTAQGRTFTVVEDSGVAAAEAGGDVGPGAANDAKDGDRAG